MPLVREGSYILHSTSCLTSDIRHPNTLPLASYRLRVYFHNCRKMYKVSGDTEILERMSPLLRGVVALEAHRPWLRRVWYLDPQVEYEEGPGSNELRSEQESFVAQLACCLMLNSFVSEERIPVGSLYILRKGLCSRGWNFLGPGRVFGEDLIVKYPQLIDTTPTVALTYVEVLRLAHPPPPPRPSPPSPSPPTALTAPPPSLPPP